MARSTFAFAVCVLFVATAFPGLAAADGGWTYDGNLRYESDDGRFAVDVVNRLQSSVSSNNPEIGEEGQSFDLNQYRLVLDAKVFEHWRVLMQTDLAAGSLDDDEEESDLLLDALVKFVKKKRAQLWIGQGKVAFGRQQLTDSGRLQFVTRSIATDRFAHGRDVGITFVSENDEETYRFSFGLYNGNGLNEAVDENEDYMAAARMVAYPLGSMPMTESDPDWSRRPGARLAIGVAVLTNQMGEGSFEEERINAGALEFAFRVRGLTLSAEFFTESRDTLTGPVLDESDTDGWYGQAGYAFPVSELGVIELAARYSEILRDVADADQAELAAVIGFFFRGHRNKLQIEYRRLNFEGLPFGENIDTEQARAQIQLIF